MKLSQALRLTGIFLVLLIGFAFPQPIPVSLPDTASGDPGVSVTVPIVVGDLTGRNVISYQGTVTYDSNILTATGVSTAGTISDGLTIFPNIQSGQITLGTFSTDPLSGSGVLVNINFDVNAAALPGQTTPLTLQDFIFNAGDPPVTLQNGLFTVTGDPDISVNPSSHDFGDVLVGSSATQTFVVSNDGIVDLVVSATTLTGADPGEFSITAGGAPFTLSPGATQDVAVSFNPASAGVKSATLSIESNDPDENPFDVPLSGNGIGIPDIAVSPTSHDYGDVLVGSSAFQTFVVSNEGTADLVVSASTLTGANPGEFSIVSGGAPFTLAPGATQDVAVSFNPTSTGAKSATLSIESNDPDENPFDVPLSGNGIGIPDIAVSPTSHDYGDVLVGSSASQTFVVSNEGTADLVVSAATLTGADPGEFSIVSGGAPFTLAPGATQDVVVSFNPTSTGTKSATLSIASNDPDENPFDVPLTGNGVGIPDIAVSPTSHDYGDVLVGSSASQTFVVSNEGTADLVVSATTLTGTNPGEFSITAGGAPFTLAPGATQDVAVSFNPTSTGAKSATLSIESNDPDENPFDVPLSGNGIGIPDIAVSPTSHDYGDVLVGSSAFQTFVVSNEGTADLVVSAATLTGADPGEFSITAGGAPFTLAPGATQDVMVSFNPTSTGAKSATLSIESNDPDENPFDVPLSGNGAPVPAPDIAVNPTSHDYGDVLVGSSASQTFVVSNEGTADLVVSATTLTGANPGEFSIVSGGAPFTLAPGATQDVAVSFNPTSTGAKSATLSIESNDPDENPFDVPLSGNGIGIPDIAVSPTSHDYGDVLVGSSASQTFVVSNEGTADLVVSATTLSGANPGEFSIVSGGAPFTLAPGATQDVVVSFNPTSTGAKSATLSIANNDPDENPFDVPLSGNGVPVPAPDIAVNPTSHDYGDVLVGSSASQTFVVSNEGTADLVVSAATLTGADPGEFSIVSGGAPFTLAPGATQDVMVSFNPTSTGAKSATLSIESNDPDENPFDVPLSGNGIGIPDIAVSPTSHDYGDVLVGSSASQTFVVSNEGTADLVVSAATLTGADPGEFSIVSGGAPFTLAPGATQDVMVSFNPTSTGAKSATLSIESNDPDENPFDVPLSGNGIAAPSVVGYVDCPGSAPQNCPFTVEIKVDMAGAAPPNHLLGSFTATLSWNPALLDYTGNSGLLSGFSGLIDDANANNGIITFNGDNLAGAGGLVDLLNVDFEATGASGSAATLDLEFSAMVAAQTSLNLLPFLTVNDCSVSITESALLGDVNGDSQVNSTDALVILSYDAGIPIPQPFLDRINAGLGDVNFDALTNSTDALIVLSYDAGIPVPFPLGDPLCPPMVASPGGREREN